jgi:hypothetical protein
VDYDEKEYLDLLLKYKSDETKKARRNLSTISFVIISARILNIKFTELRVSVVDMSKSSDEQLALLIALALLVYWFVMFSLSRNHDREIQKERSLQLEERVKDARKQIGETDETRKVAEKNGQDMSRMLIPPNYHALKTFVARYYAQRERTQRATFYGNFVSGLESIVPFALSYIAAIVLLRRIFGIP